MAGATVADATMVEATIVGATVAGEDERSQARFLFAVHNISRFPRRRIPGERDASICEEHSKRRKRK
ncbi:hypothetical protein V6N12_025101 [Hibiscus sabdariffa]|uniref:Uncharacterized protein n=1 Tax=Hibiscus sabdariffa TaxID=183260 RepID=A0ABR2BLG6_9ROSI